MAAYYNEIDPFAASWLRELIAAGHIAPGEVDERSIADVSPTDLVGYTQCHFFAGIGGWSLALRLAGVPDDAHVWTGSCPCQPFSVAGKGRGTADERHLWPELARLIAERAPPVCFGEQVASGAGRSWLAAVRADLEGLGYGVGAADLCAAGVGAPHWRQRLWWGAVRVADAGCLGLRGSGSGPAASATGGARGDGGERERVRVDAESGCAAAGGLADAGQQRRDRLDPLLRPDAAGRGAGAAPQAARHGEAHRLANPDDPRPQGRVSGRDSATERAAGPGVLGGEGGGTDHGGWAVADWLGCRDGRWRPVEPSSCGLVDGLSASLGPLGAGDPEGAAEAWEKLGSEGRAEVRRARRLITDAAGRRFMRVLFSPLEAASKSRVGRLRGYGNAIVPPLAAEFVKAYMEALDENLHGL